MSRIKQWLRDRKRGYTDADVVDAIQLLATINPAPGAYTKCSMGQLRAMIAIHMPVSSSFAAPR